MKEEYKSSHGHSSQQKANAIPPVAPELNMESLKRIMRKQTIDVSTLSKEYISLNWTGLSKEEGHERLRGKQIYTQ